MELKLDLSPDAVHEDVFQVCQMVREVALRDNNNVAVCVRFDQEVEKIYSAYEESQVKTRREALAIGKIARDVIGELVVDKESAWPIFERELLAKINSLLGLDRKGLKALKDDIRAEDARLAQERAGLCNI